MVKSGTWPSAASPPCGPSLAPTSQVAATLCSRECVPPLLSGWPCPFQKLPHLLPTLASCALMNSVDAPLAPHSWNRDVSLGHVIGVTLEGHWSLPGLISFSLV